MIYDWCQVVENDDRLSDRRHFTKNSFKNSDHGRSEELMSVLQKSRMMRDKKSRSDVIKLQLSNLFGIIQHLSFSIRVRSLQPQSLYCGKKACCQSTLEYEVYGLSYCGKKAC